MRLIGNKTKLLGEIEAFLFDRGVRGGTFIDIFTGTASVARHFKSLGFRAIANDLLSVCFTQAVAAVEVSRMPRFQKLLRDHRELLGSREFRRSFDEGGDRASQPLEKAIHILNRFVDGTEGLIVRNFSESGSSGRRYFRDAHARKIDGILEFLAANYRRGLLGSREFHLLLASLIDAADRRANISGTYGAYLKSWQTNTESDLVLKAPQVTPSPVSGHRASQGDSNRVVRRLKGDVLYIDPPYNHRQYAANYHVLEIIAEHHRIEDTAAYERSFYGKTGLRPYQDIYSDYCVPTGTRSRRRNAREALRDLVLSSRVKSVVMSYNEEGLLSRDEIGEILAEFSAQRRFDFDRNFREVRYRRFRSDRDRSAVDDVKGRARRYRVVDGKARDEIGEWLFFASRT